LCALTLAAVLGASVLAEDGDGAVSD